MNPTSASSWSDYWNGMAQRHIFEIEATDHVRRLRQAVPVGPADRVLDFGCGFGFVAELLAPHVAQLGCWDAAEGMRTATAQRTGRLPNVVQVDLGSGVPAGAEATYDLIVVTSVIQYMTPVELSGWLGRWRTLLRPGGRVVVSDVPCPGTSAVGELVGMLLFAARHGFLLTALRDGIDEARRYARSIRSTELQRWEPAELAQAAAVAGFEPVRLPVNLTHRRGRFAMELRRAH
jgi:SAM-dependent methyltransferase